ncbi:MAG: FAD-binding oxidoreductase [Candidatus Kariarchaeaceae archaeon]
MHPIDLFIGTNGIFGVVSEVTLKVKKSPFKIISIFVYCKTLDQALELINECQNRRSLNQFPIPLSVEFLDDRAVKIMKTKDDRIKEGTNAIVMLEQDVQSEEEYEAILDFWNEKFTDLGIEDTYVAQNYKEVEHQKLLRHWVPEFIISLTKSYDQALLTTDYAVPRIKTKELFYFAIEVGKEFEKFQMNIKPLEHSGYVFFAHAGDSHIHLALIPRSDEETDYANSLFITMMHRVIEMGGTIAAEHGLGKKMFENRPALHLQYGQAGIDDIKLIKLVLDPNLLLNRKNLIG